MVFVLAPECRTPQGAGTEVEGEGGECVELADDVELEQILAVVGELLIGPDGQVRIDRMPSI